MVYLEASSFHILDFNSLNRFPHVNIYKCALTPFILKARIQDAAGARTKTEGVWFMTESRLTVRVGINTCPQKTEKCNSASVFLLVLGIPLQYYDFASLKEAVQTHTVPCLIPQILKLLATFWHQLTILTSQRCKKSPLTVWQIGSVTSRLCEEMTSTRFMCSIFIESLHCRQKGCKACLVNNIWCHLRKHLTSPVGKQ